jgi:hypothetical protein
VLLNLPLDPNRGSYSTSFAEFQSVSNDVRRLAQLASFFAKIA